jgi:hypothetical protein
MKQNIAQNQRGSGENFCPILVPLSSDNVIGVWSLNPRGQENDGWYESLQHQKWACTLQQ